MMLRFIALLFSLPFGLCVDIQLELSENAHNLTALRSLGAPWWVSAPNSRGTTSIVYSCVVTLTACIYTAIHLNIPPPKQRHISEDRLAPNGSSAGQQEPVPGPIGEQTPVRKPKKALSPALRFPPRTSSRSISLSEDLLQKAKWVAIALLAPEIVLYCASSQYLRAKQLVKKLNQIRNEKSRQIEQGKVEQSRTEFLKQVPEFDLKYGFFANMGGLAVSVKDIDDNRDTVLLTSEGIITLAELWHFLPVSDDTIDDKSKASFLQKVLVIFQVTWMAMQCIARRAYGLPLTLLEIHTMVHVVCALTMYSFWFNKPLDVYQPEIVNSSKFEGIIASMILDQFYEEEAKHIMIYPPPAEQEHTDAILELPDWYSPLFMPQTRPITWKNGADGRPCKLKRGHALPGGFGYIGRFKSLDNSPSIITEDPEICLTEKAVRRWETAAQSVDELSWKPGTTFRDEFPRFPVHYLETQAANLNFSSSFLDQAKIIDFITTDLSLFVLFIILPIIYGGIHLTAWDFEFPSTTERLLWKIACIDIMTTMFIYFGGVYIGNKVRRLFKVLELVDFKSVFSVYSAFLLLAYSICRIYIVIEAFISLRKVVIGVYWTPSWIQMIPHI